MLPIIDFTRFIDATPDAQQALAEDIGRTCETMGFFYLANHGVPQGVIDAARAQAQAFFDLPDAEKRRHERARGRYRGYIPPSDFTQTAAGRPPVHYEAFLIGTEVAADDPAVAASRGMLVPNVWPGEPAGFRDAMLAYEGALRRLGDGLLRAFALALGGPGDRFARLFTKPLSNISLLHYLPRPDTGKDTPDDARAHYDTNAVTILLPGAVGGLEAQRPDGTWLAVPPLDGCFVVNIGNMMACWSGGRFKSTLHRVHPPIGVDRYSIGYFIVPNHETVVAPLDRRAVVDPALCAPIAVGEDLARFVASVDAMVPVGEEDAAAQELSARTRPAR